MERGFNFLNVFAIPGIIGYLTVTKNSQSTRKDIHTCRQFKFPRALSRPADFFYQFEIPE